MPKTYSGLIRGKWIYDGCTTLDEMVARLRGQIEELEKLRDAGVTLRHHVEDDYAFITTSDAKVAGDFGFQEDDEWDEEEGEVNEEMDVNSELDESEEEAGDGSA